MGRLERKYLAHYLEIPGDPDSVYVRLGRDLESYEEELNPKVSVQRNLAGEPNVVISGYEADGKVEQYYADPSEALFYYVQNIANKRLTDDTCRTHKVDALFDSSGVQIWAYREDCYVVPKSIGGDISGVQIPFDIYCAGNRTYGTFDPETKTFESGGEEPPSGGGVVPLHVIANGVYSGDGISYNPVIVNVDMNVPPDLYAERKIIEKDFSSFYSNSLVGFVGKYAFANTTTLKSVRLENCGHVSGYAFFWCSSMESVYMPSCSGTIDTCAFAYCYKLSDIVLNNSAVTAISNEAFRDCSTLTSVSFPNCTIISSSAFQSCRSLVSAYFPNCTSIGYSAFKSCYSLSDVNLPNCVSMEYSAFEQCSSLTSINLPKLETIPSYAFMNCARLTSVSASTLKKVSGSVFGYTAISSIYYSTLTSLSGYGFARMGSLEYAELPALPVVGSSAFYFCSKLTTVKLSVCSYISGSAFYNCSSLRSLYLYSTSVCGLYGAGVFSYTPISLSSYLGDWGSIYVPASLVATYKTATNWSVFADRITSI